MASQSHTNDTSMRRIKGELDVEQHEILEHEEDEMDGDHNLEDAVFQQANFQLEKLLLEKDNFSPTCKLPLVPKDVDLDAFFAKLYAGDDGFTASHCLAARDSLVMLCCWLTEEMKIDCSSVMSGQGSRMKFLKKLNAEHGTEWFQKFKQTKWMNLIKEMRWLERGRDVERGDFKVMRAVGRGAFGVVSVAVTRTTGEILALKEMKKVVVRHKAAAKAKSMVANERLILSMLGESPIFCCLGLRYAFECPDSYVLAFQFCAGGDLDYRLATLNKNKANTDEAAGVALDEAIFYAMELAVAIQHMHKLLILHRDLKPLNVLLTVEGHCVLSDFGLACKLKNKKDTKRGRVGTPGYLPPEMLRKENHSFPADWYSYGCTIYAMLRGLDPFHPALTHMEDRKKAALKQEVQFDDKFFSEEAKDFLRQLLDPDPAKRPVFEQIKEHALFKGKQWEEASVGLLDPVFKPGIGINAKSIVALMEEGEKDEQLVAKMKVEKGDHIKRFNFLSRKSHRASVEPLIKMINEGKYDALQAYEVAIKEDLGDGDTPNPSPNGGGCCVMQ